MFQSKINTLNTSFRIEIETFVVMPKLMIHEITSKNYNYYETFCQFIDRRADAAYKLIHIKTKLHNIKLHLLPYHTNDYALRELTQLYLLAVFHIIE